MKENCKKGIMTGVLLLLVFALWTVLVQIVDVQPAGCYEPQKNVGFAGINTWFHGLTGYSEILYKITDWLGRLTCRNVALAHGYDCADIRELI